MQYQAPTHLFKNQFILVTGAGDGLGKAAAKAYAAHGATVILLGRTLHKLEIVYDEIVNAGGAQPAIYPMNLEGATPKDYLDLADVLQNEFGELHGLLHNAAMLGATSPIQHHDIELWYKVMQTNLNAPFMLTRALLPLLTRTEGSHIVFTTDDKTRAYWGAYGTSKAGIEGLMKILAEELDTHKPVRVNAINPGAVRTRMRARAFPGEDPNTLKKPDEVMAAYLYAMGRDCTETGKVFCAQ